MGHYCCPHSPSSGLLPRGGEREGGGRGEGGGGRGEGGGREGGERGEGGGERGEGGGSILHVSTQAKRRGTPEELMPQKKTSYIVV